MTEIRVDSAELLGVAGALEAALGVGGEITSSRGSLEAAGAAAGRSDVSGAITQFIDAWGYGVQCIDKDAETLARFLRLAGEAYRHAEVAIAEAAQT